MSPRPTLNRIPRVLAVTVLAAAALACRQDMHDQPKYSSFEEAPFFADGSASRPPVDGTVARGQLRDDELLYTGMINGEPADKFPFPVDDAVMARGQEMFNAICSPCHGRTGDGNGMIVQRGFTQPPKLTEEYLKTSPPGYFFGVITNGFGAMPDHAAQIQVRDRWAIVAYVRALQASASATLADVPPAAQGKLDQPSGAPR